MLIERCIPLAGLQWVQWDRRLTKGASIMDDKTPQLEPLRRFITPEQLGLVAFMILFWALVFHYAIDRFWPTQDNCPVVVQQSSSAALNIEGCDEE
ncbi:MAG: hypothetical protein ACRC8Y_13850 [Chroococcales cyanobacterium]